MINEESRQFFRFNQQIKINGKEFTKYNWTRYKKTGKQLYAGYVIIEDRELTFFWDNATSDDGFYGSNKYRKELLKIDFNSSEHAHLIISKNFNKILENDTAVQACSYSSISRLSFLSLEENLAFTEKIEFKTFFLDFIWELFFTGNFKKSNRYKELLEVFYKDPLLNGIKNKLLFFELSKHQDPYVDIDPKLAQKTPSPITKTIFGDKLYSYRDTAIENYWRYLLTDGNEKHIIAPASNETLFQKLSYLFRPETNMHWFKGLESELATVVGQEYNHQCHIPNSNELFRKTIKLFIKRFNLAGAIAITFSEDVGNRLQRLINFGIPVFFLYFIFGFFCQCNYQSYDAYSKPSWTESLSIFFLLIIPVLLLTLGLLELILKSFTIKAKSPPRLFYLFPQIFLPRLSMAIFSGWLFFIIDGSQLNISNKHVGLGHMLLFVFFIMILVFLLFNSTRSLAVTEKLVRLVGRVSLVILIGFIISYSVGILIAPQVYNSRVWNDRNELLSADKGIIELSDRADGISNIPVITQQHIDDLNELIPQRDHISVLEKSDYKFKKKILTNYNGYVIDHEDDLLETLYELDNQISGEGIELPSLCNEGEDFLFIKSTADVSVDSIIVHRTILLNLLIKLKTKVSVLQYSLNKKYNYRTNMDVLRRHYFMGPASRERFQVCAESINSNRKDSSCLNPPLYLVNDKKPKNMSFSLVENKRHFVPYNIVFAVSVLSLLFGVFFQLLLEEKTITDPI